MAPPRVVEIGQDPSFDAEVADLIGDYDIDFFGQFDPGREAADADDAILQTVGARDPPGDSAHATAIDGVNPRRTGLARKHPEDAGARAKVHHHVAGLDHLGDGPPEGGKAVAVAEVLAMLVENQRHLIAAIDPD